MNSDIASVLRLNRFGSKADISCNQDKLLPILIYSGANLIFDVPANVNNASITYDLREFVPPNPNTNIFDFKKQLDEYVEVINNKIHRNQIFKNKSPEQLWQKCLSFYKSRYNMLIYL
jgi:hypothetical protein